MFQLPFPIRQLTKPSTKWFEWTDPKFFEGQNTMFSFILGGPLVVSMQFAIFIKYLLSIQFGIHSLLILMYGIWGKVLLYPHNTNCSPFSYCQVITLHFTVGSSIQDLIHLTSTESVTTWSVHGRQHLTERKRFQYTWNQNLQQRVNIITKALLSVSLSYNLMYIFNSTLLFHKHIFNTKTDDLYPKQHYYLLAIENNI